MLLLDDEPAIAPAPVVADAALTCAGARLAHGVPNSDGVEAPSLAPPSPAPPSPVSPAPAVARADAAVVAPVTAVVVALAAVATPPEMAPACEAAAANTGLETTDATAAVAAT